VRRFVQNQQLWGVQVVGEGDEPLPRLFIDQFRRSRSDPSIPYEYWGSSDHPRATRHRRAGVSFAQPFTPVDLSAHSHPGALALGAEARERYQQEEGPRVGEHAPLLEGELRTKRPILQRTTPKSAPLTSRQDPTDNASCRSRIVPGQHLEEAFQRLVAELRTKPEDACVQSGPIAMEQSPDDLALPSTSEPQSWEDAGERRSPGAIRWRRGHPEQNASAERRFDEQPLGPRNEAEAQSASAGSARANGLLAEDQYLSELVCLLNDMHAQLNGALTLVLKLLRLSGEEPRAGRQILELGSEQLFKPTRLTISFTPEGGL
jgi:hypothetical protein